MVGTITREKKGSHDGLVTARIKKQGENFEILVDCDKAMQVREDKLPVSEAIEVLDIFKDAKKGERAADLERYFGTDDVIQIAEEIIKKGEIQVTAEYRKKQQEKKIKEIIDLVSKRAFDPRTKLPIPPQRIELGIEKVGFHVSQNQSAIEQVKPLIDALAKVMAISIQEIRINAIVPSKYAMKAYGVFHKYGKLEKEEWHSDGSLTISMKIPAGIKIDLYDELNSFSHGEISITEE